MEDFIFTPIVLAVGLSIHAIVRRRIDEGLRSLSDLSIGAHVLSGFALIWVYQFYYGGGDIFGYHRAGVLLADVLSYDVSYLPEYIKALLQLPHRIPIDDYSGSLSSTTTAQFSSAFLHFVCGSSLYAVVTVISISSAFSKFLLFFAVRPGLSPQRHRLAFIGITLLPSAVFWTSGLLKEPLVMLALGPAMWGSMRAIQGRRAVFSAAVAVPSIGFILLLKPYVLMSLGVALGVWLLWDRVGSKRASALGRPVYLVIGVGLLVAVILGVSSAVPQLAVSQMGESMAKFRQNNALEEGGSTYYLDDPTAIREGDVESVSLVSQLRLVPLALVTALFRPAIFEVRNAMQLLNAIEATWLTVLFVQVLRRLRGRVVQEVLGSPILVLCTTFTLLLGLGTGLASSNLGSLSRYRAPMMPFYATLLLCLRQRAQEPHESHEPSIASLATR